MHDQATKSSDAATALAAYIAANDAALLAGRELGNAWRQYLEGGAEPPSSELIASVAAQQRLRDEALRHAHALRSVSLAQEWSEIAQPAGEVATAQRRIRRRRRRENKFLATLGRPGQRTLRALILLALLLSGVVGAGAGISLALELAGMLHLIDDPVQLPVGIQLVIFVVATVIAYALMQALKTVERALYGSKGIRPKRYQL